MWVEHLTLTDFRNYRHAEFSFHRGPNLLLGRNGQGKTNAVEAIAYFATLGSHRITSETALIRKDCAAAISRMRIQRNNRETLLEIQINRDGPNRAQLNRAAVKPRELMSYFSCVVFAPEDLQIARSEPSVRRRFLDEALVARQPALSAVLTDYDRVVKQRNALLKSARSLRSSQKDVADSALQTLDVWNERLITLGTKIISERENLVQSLSQPLSQIYQTLVEADHQPTINMRSTIDSQPSVYDIVPRETSVIEERFRDALRASAQAELERAVTLVGPHRDDLELSLNELPVKGYASHGETWSFVLALRLSLAALLQAESTAGDPVLILDDVFAELDARRRDRLFAAVSEYEQVIVTAAVADDVPTNVDWRVFRIDGGTLSEMPLSEGRS